MKEGNLEAPTRHPMDWKSESFNDEKLLVDELGIKSLLDSEWVRRVTLRVIVRKKAGTYDFLARSAVIILTGGC